jgi:2-polyprenyl-3-methyl-5-hydroxy-6-metoxy-1,4-benzoquinol methylase
MSETCPLCLSPSVHLFGEHAVMKREYRRCASCRLVFTPQRFHLSAQEEKERYDLHRNDPGDEAYRRFLSKLTVPLLSHLKQGAQGLDFGCGPGPAVCAMLKREGYLVRNYDPYYFAHEELLSGRYDFITCTEVAEHFADPRREFLTLRSLLKPEGAVLAVMTELWRDDKEFTAWWYQNDPCHVSFYCEDTLVWIGRWLGMEILRPHPNVALFKTARSNSCS